MSIVENNYNINHHKSFNGIIIPQELLSEVLDFAYEMCFGEGHHRAHRTGGQAMRKPGEQFCNTFQGKLAEVVLRKLLLSNNLDCGEPDFAVYGEGIWDDVDLIVNNKSLSVKSAANFSHLLLLEENDYDQDGNYLPNYRKGATASYDYYLLVRIGPDIKRKFKDNRLLFSYQISKETISEIIFKETWSYDIAGWISHDEFVSVIRDRQIIPQNATLKRWTTMDASNYYVQSGDLHDIDELCRILR